MVTAQAFDLYLHTLYMLSTGAFGTCMGVTHLCGSSSIGYLIAGGPFSTYTGYLLLQDINSQHAICTSRQVPPRPTSIDYYFLLPENGIF